MENFILLTDTHLGRNKCRQSDIEVTEALFQEVADVAEERGIRKCAHLGDFFQKWEGINLKLLPVSYQIAELLNQTFDKTYMLIGNHDIYYKNALFPTSLILFNKFENIEVIDSITEVGDYTFVPWVIPNELEKFIEGLDSITTPYLMGHFEMNNVVINRSGTIAENYRLTTKDFEKFDKVLSGHFHQPGTYGNVQYIGSPYHTDFNDSEKRGFYVVENGQLEFIEFTKAPKYVIINADDDIEQDELEGNHVRVDFHRNLGTEAIEKRIEEIKETGALTVKPRYFFTTEFTQEEQGEIELNSQLEIIFDFVQKSEVPEYINKNMLNKFIDTIYKEATEGE